MESGLVEKREQVGCTGKHKII